MAPSGRRLLAAAAAALAAAIALAPAPAAAHPNGDPQTIVVAAVQGRPDVVQVHWKVGGPDDLTLLGVELDILPADRVMMDGAVFYRAADATAIGPSQRFRDYVLQRIDTPSGRDVVFQRYDLNVGTAATPTLRWEGTADPERVVALRVWDAKASQWVVLTSSRGQAGHSTVLAAALGDGYRDGGVVHVLVTGEDPFADDLSPRRARPR